MRLKSITRLNGSYRGIGVELAPPHEHYKWCSYIMLQLDSFEMDWREQLWLDVKDPGDCTFPRWNYDYMSSIVMNVPMHGGVTYYEKRLGDHGKTGERRFIKIGCDYNHIWDEDGATDQSDVEHDLKTAINWIHDNWNPKIQCRGNGNWYSESEGSYPNGAFYSNEYANREKK